MRRKSSQIFKVAESRDDFEFKCETEDQGLQLAGLFDSVDAARSLVCKPPFSSSKITTSGYNKNIFRYIIRKAFKLGVQKEYQPVLNELCLREKASLESTLEVLRMNAETVSGVQFLECILRGREGEAIRKFLLWFLKERYLRYLREKGRMHNQQVYINFKNRFVLRQLRSMLIDE